MTRRSHTKNIPILMYHQLEPGADAATPQGISLRQFASQLDALRCSGWTTLQFRELWNVLEGKQSLPRRCVWITFDDGYTSFLDLAVPALRSRGMTATLFAVAGEIGGVNRWDIARGLPRQPLLDEQGLRAVLAAGMEIGSHGWAHRDLTACCEQELEEEILRSRQELQDRLDAEVSVFAYPYGRHAKKHFSRLAFAGYRAAVSCESDAPTVTHNLFAMRRVCVHRGDTGIRFRLKLSRLYFRYRGWVRS